jgi:hypothetical protein
MKRFCYSLAALALILPRLSAQFPNPVLFNTASDASGTGTLSINSNDLHWTVSMTGTAGPFVPAVSAGNPYPSSWAISPYPNANWISFPHTCAPISGWLTTPAEHSCLNPAYLDIYYRLGVNLPATNCGTPVSTPNAYCLSFDFYADNSVYEVLVNGNSCYINPSNNPYYDMGYSINNNVTVSLCNFWQPGSNTIIVHVRSGQGSAPTWEGLLAQVNETVTNVGVPVNLAMNTAVTPATCFGFSNGSGTITPSGSQGPFSYTWVPSGGNASIASGLSAGVYTVLVASGSCEISNTVSITQPSAIVVGVTAPEPRCAGKPVVLSATGAVSYSWQPGNLSGTSVTVSPNTKTVYTITAVNNAGCSATKTYTQNVLNCTGIDEHNLVSDFLITPNPGDGVFVLSSLQAGCTIEVVDLTGRQIMVTKALRDNMQLDLSGRQSGLYFVKVTSADSYSLKKLVLR